MLAVIGDVTIFDTHHVDGNGATEDEARAAHARAIAELHALGFELVDPPAPTMVTYRARGKSYRWRCGFGEW